MGLSIGSRPTKNDSRRIEDGTNAESTMNHHVGVNEAATRRQS
jgi:hypothetical protein